MMRHEVPVVMDEERAEIEGLRACDPAAQQRFWKVHIGEVQGICRHILGPGADAADEAVNVLADFMFKYVHHLRTPEAGLAYLRLMAVRRAVKIRNQRKSMWQRHEDAVESTIQDPTTRPADETALVSALMPRLDHCLGELTPKARQVLSLRFRADMTTEAIGSLVGGSKQYIGRLLTESLELLRQCLSRIPEHSTGREFT